MFGPNSIFLPHPRVIELCTRINFYRGSHPTTTLLFSMSGLDCHTFPYFDYRALMFIALIATLLGNVSATTPPIACILRKAPLLSDMAYPMCIVHYRVVMHGEIFLPQSTVVSGALSKRPHITVQSEISSKSELLDEAFMYIQSTYRTRCHSDLLQMLIRVPRLFHRSTLYERKAKRLSTTA